MTMTLQTFPASFGMPSASPFCTKVMCLLRMSGVDWNIDDKADVRKAPKKKFPVLLDGNEIIADSAAIADHLVQRHGADFNKGLSAEQMAQGHMLVRMVEEHTYFALMADRWLIDSHWAKLREAYFGDMPFGLRQLVSGFVRKDVSRSCLGQGMSRHSVPDMAARVQQDVNALEMELGDGPYFFGNEPSMTDASIASLLDSLLNKHFPDGITQHLTVSPTLQTYLDRCRDTIFPTEEVMKWRET